MPRRTGVFLEGGYYHVYNRGADRQPIFKEDGHYEYCLRLLKRYREEYRVVVVAYCLMPNHYHMLVRQDSNISAARFVGVIFNSYTQALNRRLGRTGTLFEGRFKHRRIEDDGYAARLCCYIHLNPVNAGLVQLPGEWPYSNYLEWIEGRGGTLVDRAFIRERFATPEEYQAFVAERQQDLLASRVRGYPG